LLIDCPNQLCFPFRNGRNIDLGLYAKILLSSTLTLLHNKLECFTDNNN
jgi:hypothetical protein